MKRSIRTAFNWMLGVAVLALTMGLPVAVWGAPTSAGGGDDVFDIEEDGVPYRIHVFTNTGPATLTITNGGFVDFLVVGGGGGGGGDLTSSGGGGGIVYRRFVAVTNGQQISVTVGAGGIGSATQNAGKRGEASLFGDFTAYGGGGKGDDSGNGASGSGSSGRTANEGHAIDYAPYQGHDGGVRTGNYGGGGGGGAGGVGGGAGTAAAVGGNGGIGLDYSHVAGVAFGDSGWFGGGGGGCCNVAGTGSIGKGGKGGGGDGGSQNTPAKHGLPNSGGGGGGGGNVAPSHIGGNGGSGIVIVRYASGPFTPVPNVTLTDPVTGSTRFTNTNAVKITSFPQVADYDQFQYTIGSNLVFELDAENWISTNALFGYCATFDHPTTDTNILFSLWFTNATDTAGTLLRSSGQIYYTSEFPVAAVRPSITRSLLPDTDVIITAEALDNGSNGGVANGIEMDLIASKVVAINPAHDLSPDATYVTLPRLVGEYPLQLWLQNEAGSAITSATTCTVTVVEYSGTNTWTGEGSTALWSNGVNWRAGVPVDGQNVTVEAGSLTLDQTTADLASFTMTGGTVTFTNWSTCLRADSVMLTGGTLTLPAAFDESQMSNRVWVACTDFTLGANASIVADYLGYGAMQGPGKGGATQSGAGHGGIGSPGGGGWDTSGAAYDDVLAPQMPGSGGGSSLGGGAVWIQASGMAVIHGMLSADGQNGVVNRGGGSGGSILINCNTFRGSPTGWLRVRGGNGNNLGGPGSGGRIAVVYNPVAQAALDAPNPGVRFSASSGAVAFHKVPLQPGTLYLPEMETLFLSDNLSTQWDMISAHIPGFTSWTLGQLTISGKIAFPQLRTLRVGNDLTVNSGGMLTLYGGTNVLMEPSIGMHTVIGGALTVGGTLELCTDRVLGASPFLECGEVNLATTGNILADYRGFDTEMGEGAGAGNSGGGYGGAGGGPVGGPANGKRHAPVFAGSGGGNSSGGGGRGGGAVRIVARGTMHLNGTISANGMTAPKTHGAGGAGGTILLTAKSFDGSGAKLSANGGNGAASFGCGGGGGRIALLSPGLTPAKVHELSLRNTPGSLEELTSAAWPDLSATLTVNPGARGSNYADQKLASEGSMFYGSLIEGTVFILR